MAKMLTKAHLTKLLKNGAASAATAGGIDHQPVVKLFGGSCTWLLSEIDPQNPDIAFGLCDLGFGTPEMGSVSIAELESIRFPPFRLPIERDQYFTAGKTLSEYASDARSTGRIVA